jgi:serine/threonine protein kinase/DNA-binding beta-propeller fold protein YncE
MTDKHVILGKYEVMEEIGRGGMGIVYKARDLRIERVVAIKELLINPALVKAAQEIIARFHREAQTAGSLQHPNIVTIHDFGEDQGKHYIAMEFIEGKNLKEYMEDGHSFSQDQLYDILIQICEGLQHAHERKIVHRDIKPDNISITSKGVVKITDFGIARMSTNNPMMQMTQDGTMLGTLGYISPEQLQNSSAVDHRADIFSLGAMMYELYTTKLPFDGGNLGATILKIVSEDPVPPTRLNPDMDPRMETIIMKALQKLPDYRYQSAGEIVIDLRQLKSGANSNSSNNDSSASGMVVCPCEKKNMIFSGAKFCPYCGLNLDQMPAPSQAPSGSVTITSPPPPDARMPYDRTASLQQDMFRSTEPVPTPAPPKSEKPNAFRSRLSHLMELATTYQSSLKAAGAGSGFSRVKEDSAESPTVRRTFQNPASAQQRSTIETASPFAHLNMGTTHAATSSPTMRSTHPGDIGGLGNEEVSKSSLQVRFSHKIGQVGAGKGQFYQPRGLAIHQGMVFVADTQNQRIQVFNKMGDWQYLIRSSSQQEYLKAPCNVAVSKQGQIYVVDSGTCRIAVFDQSGRFIKAFGSTGKAKGEFSNPYGIAVSSKDEIYVADTENSRIQVLDSNGQVSKIFGRPGTRPGEFKTPYAIALDSKDNLYVLDYGIPRIQVLDRHGICRLEFGKRGVRDGEFSIPRGISVDIRGRIYVADTLNHRVQVFTPKGEFIEAFGTKGRGPNDFWGPESIAISDEGEIFVLDKGNSRIQVLTSGSF